MRSHSTRIDASVIAREPDRRVSKNSRRRGLIGLVAFVSVWLVVASGMLWFYYEHVLLNGETIEEIQFLFEHVPTTEEEKRNQDQAIARFIEKIQSKEEIKNVLRDLNASKSSLATVPALSNTNDNVETIRRNLRIDPVADRFSTRIHLKSPRPYDMIQFMCRFPDVLQNQANDSSLPDDLKYINYHDLYYAYRIAVGAIAREYAEAISTIVKKIESDDRRAGVDRERREAIVDRTNREIPLENFRRDLFDKKKKMMMRLYPEQSINHDPLKLAESIRARRSYEKARRTEPRNSFLLRELSAQWKRAENELRRSDSERIEAAIEYGAVDGDDFERLCEHIMKMKDIVERSQAELLGPSSGSTRISREMIARRGRTALDRLDRIERESMKWIEPLRAWKEEKQSAFRITGSNFDVRDPTRLERLQALEGPALGSLIALATVLFIDRKIFRRKLK
jgi:hypothetical protein